MGSLPANDTYHSDVLEDRLQPEMEESACRTERTNWLLNSPEAPNLWRQLIGSFKEATCLPGKIKKNSKKQNGKDHSPVSLLMGVFPILDWGRSYNAWKFKRDLMAGLTLASLCIPQSISYANLARLDAQYGLYTSVVPPLIYSVMGSSKEIAIGPVAVVSMLLSSMIPKIVDPTADPIGYRNFVFTVTFFAGTFQFIFGLFRLGFLIDFLSHAAIVGFMAGAAIVIGLQQLKGLFGISNSSNKTDVVSVLHSVFKSLQHHWYPLNVVLGCSFLILLLLSRYVGRRNKKLFWLSAMAPLLSVILSTLIVFLTKADDHGVKIVKHIKGGINPISLHQLQFKSPHLGEAAKIGFITAIVALTEAIAVGRSFASIKGYHLDGNKEMLAMGCTNLVGSMTSCYVATGSFSRTAVNFSAGCETVVSNIVMAITVVLSLEAFTKLLYYTPTAILASIILSALPGLIDIKEARNIWKVDKLDFLACVGAFLGVLFASVEIGLLVALIISFAKLLLNSIRPAIGALGRLPRTDIFCEMNQYPMAIKTPGIMIIRVNSALLCFANANFIRERILACLDEEDDENEETAKGRIQVVILDLSNVMNIDTSGIIAMEELNKKLVSHGIQLAMANPRWQVINKLKRANFINKIGAEWIFLTVSEAVNACIALKLAGPSSC
ncbi:low affinity sulfate transporter 3-like [Rutidosis leptorrhynchoides]|uniref:low affinity sulfate transporter 3-like n=1 Tax=Rutidosis leptorrhynchoides TaxID=125765 RepID=UPI003A9A2B53